MIGEKVFDQLAVRRQKLCDQAAMTREVGDERLPYRIRDQTRCLKARDVEEVARVLTIQRRTEFATIEIGRVKALDLHEQFICLLRGRAQFACDGRCQAAADDDTRLHFDACAGPVHEHLRCVALDKLDVDARNGSPKRFSDFGELRTDTGQRSVAIRNREVGEVDVDGQPGMFRRNRLMAVPPLIAKSGALATAGRQRIRSST